jgi:hypothetical protein
MMTKKKNISEQNINDPNAEFLKKAMELGCFRQFTEALAPKGLRIDPTPIQDKNGEFVLKAIGKKSGKTYYVHANPQRIVDEKNPSEFFEWECPSLGDKSVRVQSDIERLRASREEQSGIDCVNTFRELYENYLAVSKGGATLDTTVIDRLRKNAQACLIKPEVKRKLFLSKIPGINQRFEKIFNELKSINPADTRLKFFRLVENENISKLIKKTLKEFKQVKETKKIEKKIFESRINMVFEGFDKFEKLNQQKKVKTGFKTLKEIREIQKSTLMTETLGSLFKGIYGKSFESSIGSISEPLFNMIFTKISLDEDLKGKIMDNLQSKTEQLIASMDSCLDFSKFLTDIISEEYAKKLDNEKKSGMNVLQSALMDAVDDEMFRKNLQTKIESEVCKLYEKFTENAKNLMVRMNAL